jgi:hypothetical protein
VRQCTVKHLIPVDKICRISGSVGSSESSSAGDDEVVEGVGEEGRGSNRILASIGSEVDETSDSRICSS